MTPQPPIASGLGCLSRRALLTALGATGAAASLAACDAPGPSTPPGDSADSPRVPASGTSISASSTPTDAPQQVLTTTTAVPVGGGKIVSGILIVQPTAGQFVAYDARCPHRGAPLSPPKAGVVTCYEHHSTFRDTDGALLGGPARRGLRQVPIIVDGTTITKTA
jgi:nitrite reductase/ring-hydroxylating ferredoxin subunit